MMHRVVIMTGSNMGARDENLLRARNMLEEKVGPIVAQSALYRSEPWGEMEDGAQWFLNQALVLETELEPLQLLECTQDIERLLGRIKKGNGTGTYRKYCSRAIDIDILYYDELVRGGERLELPHPMIALREFVLVPLAEALPQHRHPVTGKTAAEMLEELRAKSI